MFRLEVNTFHNTFAVETLAQGVELAERLAKDGIGYVELDRVYTDEIGNEHYESVKIWTR